MCICLWPDFDCPEVTLCGWQDIKIQLLLLLLLLLPFPRLWCNLATEKSCRCNNEINRNQFEVPVVKWWWQDRWSEAHCVVIKQCSDAHGTLLQRMRVITVSIYAAYRWCTDTEMSLVTMCQVRIDRERQLREFPRSLCIRVLFFVSFFLQVNWNRTAVDDVH